MAHGEENYIIRGPPLEYEARYASAGKFIFDCLRKNPTFIGQIEAHTGHKYTFAEILDRSIRLALWLRDMEVRPGDVVGYVTRNHKDVIIVVYATLFVGAVLSPWDASLTTQNVAYFMDRTKPKIVICSKDAANSVKSAAEELHLTPVFVVHGELSGFISFEDTQGHSNTEVRNFQCTEVEENHVALLVCTSGTSASPKIMQRTHKSILIVAQTGERPSTGSVFITFAQIFWITGFHAAVIGPSGKLQRVIAPYFAAELAWKWIEQYQVNYFTIGTAMFLRMIYCKAISNYDISSLHVAEVGGTSLAPCCYEIFEKFAPVNCKLFQRYGITEMSGTISIQNGKVNPGSCGPLIPGTSGKIVNPLTGQTISPCEPGELCVKNSKMFGGYYNDPKLTESVVDSDGWYHTGDLAKFDKNGELFVIDRLMDMIDVNGFKVSPSELESILIQHPEVESVGVVGKGISANVEHPVAFVVKRLGSNVTEAEICNFVKTQVSDDAEELRGGVRFIDEMPCSSSGKVKRTDLRKMLELET